MRRSRHQFGLRVTIAAIVILSVARAGIWKFMLQTQAEKEALQVRLVRIEKEARQRELRLHERSRAFIQSIQERERRLRHQIGILTRDIAAERALSQSAASAMREQIQRLRAELGRTQKELLAEQSGRFIQVAQENQPGLVWILHLWALFSKETGKPLYSRRAPPAKNGPVTAPMIIRAASGSGFVVNPKGWILTVRHLIEPWKFEPALEKAGFTGRTVRLTVIFADTEKVISARVLRLARQADLALLAIRPFSGMSYMRHLNPDPALIRQGAPIAVLGFPLNPLIDGYARSTLTSGVLSAPIRNNRIQFDASINPGNSGGPMLNVRGEIIGVVQSAAATPTGERVYGINFGVPIGKGLELMREVSEN